MKVTSVQITDYSPEFLKQMHVQALKGLKAIGVEAEGYAKDNCPVDTGRLRNSIAWATKEEWGNKDVPDKFGDDIPKETPEDYSVYIGTNVEYAERQEYGNFRHKVGRKHFLRDGMAAHKEHYKAIMEAALKGK